MKRGCMRMNFVPGLLLLAATRPFAALPEAIQRVTLDERVVITVPVLTNRVGTFAICRKATACESATGAITSPSAMRRACCRNWELVAFCQVSLPPACAAFDAVQPAQIVLKK